MCIKGLRFHFHFTEDLNRWYCSAKSYGAENPNTTFTFRRHDQKSSQVLAQTGEIFHFKGMRWWCFGNILGNDGYTVQ